MKSDYEKIINNPYISWSFLYRSLDKEIPFQWHHHPEYELTLTLNSFGVKYIGSDVNEYKSDDLVLIGPNVSHSWKSQGKFNVDEPHLALVIWFSGEWLDKLIEVFPEMKLVKDFLKKVTTAVVFSDEVIEKVKPDILKIAELDPPYRTPLLLNILLHLASDMGATSFHLLHPGMLNEDGNQVKKVLEVIEFLNNNYSQRITVESLAEKCHVSQTTFHRIFKRVSKKSPIDYIISVRILHASKLLIDSGKPVSFIAEEVGYSSLSLFNRHFRLAKNMTPREFREQYKKNN